MREATIGIGIKCRLDEEHFAGWENLTPEQKAVFDKDFPNCEDSGTMSSWCEGCPFCVSFSEWKE